MKAVVFSLGCKTNQYDGGQVAMQLENSGFEVFFDLQFADLYIINTCSVTSEADKKSRQAIARALKFNQTASVFVLGCSAISDPESFKKHKSVRAVVGIENRQSLLSKAIDDFKKDFKPLVNFDNSAKAVNQKDLQLSQKSRPMVKIQDGCNRFCSYCIVPHLRGASRSVNAEEILSTIKLFAQTAKEISITGIDISSYGKDCGSSLCQLIDQINLLQTSNQIPGDVRFRLGSLKSEIIDDNLLLAMQKTNFCDHFHLSLQSGSDRILSKMNRKYTAKTYLQKVDLVRKYFPHAAITTDIIVGFPTETDDDFYDTISLVRQARFAFVHIFKYSPRKNTPAFDMPQVDEATKSHRAAILKNNAKMISYGFLSSNLDKKLTVFVEGKTADGLYNYGYTSNYIKVYTKSKIGSYLPLALKKLYKDGVLANE